MSTARYPDAVAYTVVVSGTDGSTPRTNHYRGLERPALGEIDVRPISTEEAAQPPPVPHGINVFIQGIGRVGRLPPSPDVLGVPLLAPTYMFGLTYAPHPRSDSGGDAEVPALPVIALVSSSVRDYAVSYVGSEPIDGTPTDHLRLKPLRKPNDNRLRDLWIGKEDDLPRRAVVSGNFTLAPFVDVPWTIDFSVIDGAPYIQKESASATLRLPHRRVVGNAAVSFEQVQEAGSNIYDKPLVTPEATGTTLLEPNT